MISARLGSIRGKKEKACVLGKNTANKRVQFEEAMGHLGRNVQDSLKYGPAGQKRGRRLQMSDRQLALSATGLKRGPLLDLENRNTVTMLESIE